MPESSDEEELANLTLAVDDEDTKVEAYDANENQWATVQTLKSHLDLVRSVSFGSGKDLILASGSDDNTVKVWKLEPSGLHYGKPKSELEPIITYRGHTAAVTTVLVSSPLEVVFSASMDSTIRVWQLPAYSQAPYAPHDPDSAIQTLEGHTDAVWDLVLSSRADEKGSPHRLITASADGTVKQWTSESRAPWSLTATYTFDAGVVPTCLSLYAPSPDKVLIGFSNGVVKLWDLIEGREEASFGKPLEGEFGITPGRQGLRTHDRQTCQRYLMSPNLTSHDLRPRRWQPPFL